MIALEATEWRAYTAEELIKKSKPYVNAIICSDTAVMQLCKKLQL